jgi:hypothetical protein
LGTKPGNRTGRASVYRAAIVIKMMNAIEVTLPAGCWIDGSRKRAARLRPITGEDEAFLQEAGQLLLPAQWVTALLSRCLVQLGPLEDITEEIVRSLSSGDREALLLHLHRITFGNRLECIAACPSPQCHQEMDLDLNATDLLLSPYANAMQWHEADLQYNGHAYRMRFRLPTGGDQEAVLSLAFADLRAASSMLLSRCIGSIVRDDGGPVEGIPSALEEQLSNLIGELDPQAELILNMACPICGGRFSAIFDAMTHLSHKMACHLEQIYREVHFLAFYYHWSESEIMGMTQKKRQRYLELLDETLKEVR